MAVIIARLLDKGVSCLYHDISHKTKTTPGRKMESEDDWGSFRFRASEPVMEIEAGWDRSGESDKFIW